MGHEAEMQEWVTHKTSRKEGGKMGLDVKDLEGKWEYVIIHFRGWLRNERGHLKSNHDLRVLATENSN